MLANCTLIRTESKNIIYMIGGILEEAVRSNGSFFSTYLFEPLMGCNKSIVIPDPEIWR